MFITLGHNGHWRVIIIKPEREGEKDTEEGREKEGGS
jgi:hypothetical protein